MLIRPRVLVQRSHGGGKKVHQLSVLAQQRPPLDVEHILQHRRLPGRQEDINTLYKARG